MAETDLGVQRADAALRGLARSGRPKDIVASRGLQAVLRRLLAYLPRLGLLQETMQLITTIQEMETNHPVGPGAITEFDQMFKIGCRAIVRALVAASEGWTEPSEPGNDSELIAFQPEQIDRGACSASLARTQPRRAA